MCRDTVSANPAGSGFESLAAHKPQVRPTPLGVGQAGGTVNGHDSLLVSRSRAKYILDLAVTFAVYAHGLLATLAGLIRRCLQGCKNCNRIAAALVIHEGDGHGWQDGRHP